MALKFRVPDLFAQRADLITTDRNIAADVEIVENV